MLPWQLDMSLAGREGVGALGFLFTLCINGRGEVDFDRVFGRFGAFSDRFTGVFAYTMHAYSLPHSPQQSIALCWGQIPNVVYTYKCVIPHFCLIVKGFEQICRGRGVRF